MILRKGKTKFILISSIESALLAVEVYNKPRIHFKVEAYILLMIIAWTKLFHSYFNHEIGNKYYYKKRNGRYEIVDGERKAWDLKTCIKKFGKLRETIKANLEFFIGLRNKVEHRYVTKSELDILIFGECQSLLYNYENILIEIFGQDYSINENLAYSLQFSQMRTNGQILSNKKVLSREIRNIREYVEKYRSSLSDDIFCSQEYSIKLIQIPKISNTNRNDLSVEFVRWDELSEEDVENYKKLDVIIKDKIVKKEAINIDRIKPGVVLERIEERTGKKLSHYDHMCFYYVFSVRPISNENLDPFETNTKYCHYDEPHDVYVYQETWVDFLVKIISERKVSISSMRNNFKAQEKIYISNYE